MDPMDLLTNPAYSWYPGNIFGEAMRSVPQPSAPPAPPAPPPPPRMGQRELDVAVDEIAVYFANPTHHEDEPGGVSASEMRRAMGNVSPAATHLLELALADGGVRNAMRRATREGFLNQRDVSTADLQALARGGTTLSRLRNAVRVDPTR